MSRKVLFLLLVAGLLLAAGSVPARSAGPVPEPYPFSDRYPAEISLSEPNTLALLLEAGIELENPRPAGPETVIVTVYITPAEADWLREQGLDPIPIPNQGLRAFQAYGPGSSAPNAWPTFDQFVTRMQTIAASYPDLVRMVSAGQSVQGREIWLLKISDNPDQEEDEPEVKYSSTMHGDEPVGTEMTIRLAELLTANYGIDPYLTALVDEMEIWLCPLHNPDGYVNGTRYNAHGVDLNRNFPAPITGPNDDPAGREPETQALMYFGYAHRFVMGANYHGGAQVVNVPWDSFVGYAPDDAIFYEYGVGYAVRNPYIWNGGFPEGFTRGWEWYIIHGGMQDWAYNWQHEHHVTIELSNTKWPPYSQMDSHWDANREAMLYWMERSLNGARGTVTSIVGGEPLDAELDVVQIGKIVRTDPDVGDYHRLLLPGSYTLTVSADGYLGQAAPITVISGTATVQNFVLYPDQPYAIGTLPSQVAGPFGSTVTHTIPVTNAGNLSDSYTLTLGAGAWNATLLESQLGPLASGEGALAQVRVEIPDQPAGRASVIATDTLTLTIQSQGDPAVSAQSTGRTRATAALSLTLATGTISQTGQAGRTVSYSLALSNTGDYTDSYALSLAGNLWPSQVVPTRTTPLAPGGAAGLALLVSIPGGPGGETDSVTVRASSNWDPAVEAQVTLTTRREWSLFLPTLWK